MWILGFEEISVKAKGSDGRTSADGQWCGRLGNRQCTLMLEKIKEPLKILIFNLF